MMFGTYAPARMTGRALRSLVAAAAAVVATATIPVEGISFVDPGVAHAEKKGQKTPADDAIPPVGARLVAVTDVELDEAVVRAGSHVSVVARKAKAGRVLLDVALADGHVVRGVPLQQLRSSFRVA